MKNFNAVSHNCARPYFPIQHGRGRGRGRGEVRARRVYLNVHSTGNVVDTEWSVEFWRWKCCREFGNTEHLRPRAVVGYGVKIFLPSPPNCVTRSPGRLAKFVLAWNEIFMSDLDIKTKKFVKCPRRPHDCKTGDFMSLTGPEQLRKMRNTGKACKTVF